MQKDPTIRSSKPEATEPLPGNPVYPAKDDIYSRGDKEPLQEESDSEIDQGLDIPGAELDDANEIIGEEDEENNYYSLPDDTNNAIDENEK
ncbi:MAG: hypothetical protein HYU71_05025 [Bacteroidetes bacterium]|nr:hypothetical protein [Bacteroidota bacterium]